MTDKAGGSDPSMEECVLDEDSGQASSSSGVPRGLQHVSFVEVLLEQCERHMWNFRTPDLLHLALALSALARSGNDNIFPSRLFRRLHRRMDGLYFELLPGQIVRFLDVAAHLPELEGACTAKMLDEAAYRIRDITPASCLSVLRAVRRIGGHARAHSAVSWRLAREDAGKTLSPAQVCEAAEALRDLRPWLWEAREALLAMLQGLHRRQQEPQPVIIARLLRVYGELSVRDTHWFRLCAKLFVCDLSTLKPTKPLDDFEPLEETVIADAALALARLNFPRLVDAGALFSRAATTVKSREQVAAVLEAVGIFCLIERRPRDLEPGRLAPLLAEWPGLGEAPPLRLFPFSDTASTTCTPEVLEEMRAAAVSQAAAAEPDEFQLSVGRELASWSGIGLVSSVSVGPLVVPWAASLVGLADHLKKNPLEPRAVPARAEDMAGVEDLAAATAWGSEADAAGGVDAEDSEETDDEGSALGPAPAPPSGGRRSRRGRGAPKRPVDPGAFEHWAEVAAESPGLPTEVAAETHILVELLRDGDFYHASDAIRSDRQRSKRQLLSAQRFAELSLLRRSGWRVCCIPEHLWSIGPDGDAEASHTNRKLFFRLVANLAEQQ